MNKTITFFILIISACVNASDSGKISEAGAKTIGWRDIVYANTKQKKGTITLEQWCDIKQKSINSEIIEAGKKSHDSADAEDSVVFRHGSSDTPIQTQSIKPFADDVKPVFEDEV